MKCPPSERLLDISNPWLRNKAQAEVARAFEALPVIQALNRMWVAHGHRLVWVSGQASAAPHVLALGSLLVAAVALAASRQRRLRQWVAPAAPEPLNRTAAEVVAALWVVAVAFMAEPWLVHAGHWGRSDRAETVR